MQAAAIIHDQCWKNTAVHLLFLGFNHLAGLDVARYGWNGVFWDVFLGRYIVQVGGRYNVGPFGIKETDGQTALRGGRRKHATQTCDTTHCTYIAVQHV